MLVGNTVLVKELNVVEVGKNPEKVVVGKMLVEGKIFVEVKKELVVGNEKGIDEVENTIAEVELEKATKQNGSNFIS